MQLIDSSKEVLLCFTHVPLFKQILNSARTNNECLGKFPAAQSVDYLSLLFLVSSLPQ